MAAPNELHGFAVVRINSEGVLSRTYLREFVSVGRSGLRRLAFGPRMAAHVFESRTEAEDVVRRLRRRVSDTHYDYRIEEISREVASAV